MNRVYDQREQNHAADRRDRERSKFTGFRPKPKPRSEHAGKRQAANGGWSHQNDLADGIGKKIMAVASCGPVTAKFEGVLVATDAFTLKIDQGEHGVVTLFKSAMIYYTLGTVESKQA